MEIERRVLQLVASGDVRGAATLAIGWLRPRIRQYLRAVLRNDADAADAYSRFEEALWRDLPNFRAESSLTTWAFSIAVHAGMQVRNDAWHRRVCPFASGEASGIAEEIRTSSKLRGERQRQSLEALRQALTPQDQTLLTLRLDQRLSWEEIAQVLTGSGQSVSVAALCKRFEQLKRRLERMARDEGLVDSS